MAITATFDPVTGLLQVFGDEADNAITISRDAAGAILINGGAVEISGGTPTVDNTSGIAVQSAGGVDTVAFDETNGALPPADVNGGSSDDTLTGSAGDDIVNGGSGADTMTGGLGNDTYIVDNAGDTVIEANGGGIDTVTSSVSFSLVGSELENLVLVGAANINGSGNALDNMITGNAGNNLLNGGAGADTLSGGLGNDTYVVDNAGDTVIETNGGGIDIVTSSVSFSLVGGELENLVLVGTANINGSGNAQANSITGNAGNNLLNGGAGNDTMTGGLGNDTYIVDNSGDTVIEANGGGIDTVSSSVSFSLVGGELENLVLVGAANTDGSGNVFDNTITGNVGSNLLSGGAGNDVLNGGAGNDTINGGTGLDSFVFNTTLDATTNVDHINDFVVIDDTVRLENAIFTALATGTLSADAFVIGTEAADASDRVIYDDATGALIYDANGNAAGGATQFATLSTGLALTNADFLVI